MANAKKCDRCGVLYEISDKDDVPSYKGMKVRKLTIGSPAFELEFDLCPSCAKAAMSFLFYKEEEENEGE